MGVNADGTWDGAGEDPNTVVPDVPEETGVDYGGIGEDIQNAEGTEFSGYKPAEEAAEGEYDPTAVAAGESFVSPESTVAGQLESILKKGSPLQDLATSRSREQASALGMSSSTGAIGASQRALYDSAMPIAQQDADAFSKFKLGEQRALGEKSRINTEAQVSGGLNVQKAELAQQQKREDDFWALQVKDMDFKTEEELTAFRAEIEQSSLILKGKIDANVQREGLNLKGSWDKTLQGLDAATQESLVQSRGVWEEAINNADNATAIKVANGEIDAQLAQTLMTQNHDMMNQYQISIQQMIGNKDFLDNFDGVQADMYAFFDSLFAPIEASMRFGGKIGEASEEYTDWLDDLATESMWSDA